MEINQHFILSTSSNLQDGENQFRAAFEFSAIGMALSDLNGRLFRVNGSLCKMLGYESTTLVKHTFQDLTHPEDFENDLYLLKRLEEDRCQNYQLEIRYIHASGHLA